MQQEIIEIDKDDNNDILCLTDHENRQFNNNYHSLNSMTEGSEEDIWNKIRTEDDCDVRCFFHFNSNKQQVMEEINVDPQIKEDRNTKKYQPEISTNVSPMHEIGEKGPLWREEFAMVNCEYLMGLKHIFGIYRKLKKTKVILFKELLQKNKLNVKGAARIVIARADKENNQVVVLDGSTVLRALYTAKPQTELLLNTIFVDSETFNELLNYCNIPLLADRINCDKSEKTTKIITDFFFEFNTFTVQILHSLYQHCVIMRQLLELHLDERRMKRICQNSYEFNEFAKSFCKSNNFYLDPYVAIIQLCMSEKRTFLEFLQYLRKFKTFPLELAIVRKLTRLSYKFEEKTLNLISESVKNNQRFGHKIIIRKLAEIDPNYCEKM